MPKIGDIKPYPIGGHRDRIQQVVGGCVGCIVSFGLAPYLRGELFSILFPWWAGSLLGITSAEVCWRLLPREASLP